MFSTAKIKKKAESAKLSARLFLSVPLLTEFAAVALVEFAAEALLYEVVEAVAEGLELHVVDDLVDEGVLQQELGLVEGDAALTHVEEGGVVELAYGGAVGALHVVCIDLEHRLGVHTGFLRGRQVLIRHLRRGLLGSMPHQHAACEGPYSLIVEYIFIQLVRGAM